MSSQSNLRLNGDRLWASLMEMAKIGPGVAGGNNRQACTDVDAEGRVLFQTWCDAEGLAMSIDEMGNMFAKREGADPSLPPVIIGSHLDTQPTGGKYDGVLGVLAAMEIVRTLNEAEVKTKHPIEIANFTNEEGSRFAPSMMGSAVMAGIMDRDFAYGVTDEEGLSFGSELERIGYKGVEPAKARPIHAFLEFHIEQGPILEDEGIEIGVVTHGQGLRWIEFTLTGKAAHTGTTPMEKRLNAGLAMARITECAHRIALDYGPHAKGAVGYCVFSPNSRNIVAEEVVCTADMRHPDLETLLAIENDLITEATQIASDMGVGIAVKNVGKTDPTLFDATCVNAIRDAASRLGYSHRDIISGAGHDACYMAKIAPTAMVFCPCVDGLSHNEAEEITQEWASAGANVLFHAALELAEVVG